MNFDWENWFAEVDKLEDELNHHTRLTQAEAHGYLARLPHVLDGNLSYAGDCETITARNLYKALTILPVIVGRPYIFSVRENYVEITTFNGAQKLDFIVDENHSCHVKLSQHDPKSGSYQCYFLADAAVTKRWARVRVIGRLLSLLEEA